MVPWVYEESEIEMGLSLDGGFFGQVRCSGFRNVILVKIERVREWRDDYYCFDHRSSQCLQVFTGALNGEIVAIKSPDRSRMDPEDYLKCVLSVFLIAKKDAEGVKRLSLCAILFVLREADIARLCKHPNVLETIGICRSRYFIITEYDFQLFFNPRQDYYVKWFSDTWRTKV